MLCLCIVLQVPALAAADCTPDVPSGDAHAHHGMTMDTTDDRGEMDCCGASDCVMTQCTAPVAAVDSALHHRQSVEDISCPAYPSALLAPPPSELFKPPSQS